MRLKELADDLKSQRQDIGAKGRKVISDQTEMADHLITTMQNKTKCKLD